MNTAQRWFDLVHCIRPHMEFQEFLRIKQKNPEGKSVREHLAAIMTAGDYQEQVRLFLEKSFETIQSKLIEPYLKANPPKTTNNWNLLSGAFTFFSREKNQAFTHFINWDKPSDAIQQEINPGFSGYCQQKQLSPSAEGGCQSSNILNIHNCFRLRECLGRFINELHYTCSRLVERKVPVRVSLSLNLKRLNEITPNPREANRVYSELFRFKSNATEDPLFREDIIGQPRGLTPGELRVLISKQGAALSSDTRRLIVNIYKQIIESPLLSLPDKTTFSMSAQNVSVFNRKNMTYLAHNDKETGHPYSLREFIQLVLALTVIYRAPWFYLLHFGPAVAGQEQDNDELPIGTGTLVMNSVKLTDELLGYITILSETAISSLARAEALVLQDRLETAKRNLYLAESAYGVGHTQKDRFTRVLNHLEFAEGHVMPEYLDVEKALACIVRAKQSVRKAVASSKTMDFMANLFQVHGRTEEVNSRWFVKGAYDISNHIRSELDTFERIPSIDLTPIEGVQIQENLLGGRYRLYDEFYDDLIHEIISNAVRRGAVSLNVAFDIINVLCDNSLHEYESLVFTNNTDADNFEARLGLTAGRWLDWPISENGPKGALRQIAIRLRVTGQGYLFAKPEQKGNQWLFNVALNIVGMNKHKEKQK